MPKEQEEEKRKDVWQYQGLIWEDNKRGQWGKYLITFENTAPFQSASGTDLSCYLILW
jgi:hypothetical protein